MLNLGRTVEARTGTTGFDIILANDVCPLFMSLDVD